jgi:hypothetical protein
MLHNNAKTRARDVGQPRIHCMLGGHKFWEWLADDYPTFHIQGSNPQVFWVKQDQARGGQTFDWVDRCGRDAGASPAYHQSDGCD